MPEFRNAVPSDVPVIRSMVQKIWPLTYGNILSAAQIDYMIGWMYDPEKLTEQMKTGHTFIMATDRGASVGFAAFGPLPDSDVYYHLDKLYLLPEAQGKGIGKKMLEEAIRRIQILGGKYLQLHVARKNSATRFYTGLGFVIVREEDNDIGEGFFMNDYVMQLDL